MKIAKLVEQCSPTVTTWTVRPPYYQLLANLVAALRPCHVVELGTGTGLASAAMIFSLPRTGRLTTINWPNPPSGDDVGKELEQWRLDPRLKQIRGDTREVSDQVPGGIDFLFIDSGTEHTYDLIAAEWRLYRPKLAADAIVCVDDLDFPGGGIRRFWDALPYDKVETKLSTYGFGVLQYTETITDDEIRKVLDLEKT